MRYQLHGLLMLNLHTIFKDYRRFEFSQKTQSIQKNQLCNASLCTPLHEIMKFYYRKSDSKFRKTSIEKNLAQVNQVYIILKQVFKEGRLLMLYRAPKNQFQLRNTISGAFPNTNTLILMRIKSFTVAFVKNNQLVRLEFCSFEILVLNRPIICLLAANL